jgi:hypothetical protein
MSSHGVSVKKFSHDRLIKSSLTQIHWYIEGMKVRNDGDNSGMGEKKRVRRIFRKLVNVDWLFDEASQFSVAV